MTKIDVLAVMDGAWRVFASQSIRSGDGADYQADAVKEARAAVAELIESAVEGLAMLDTFNFDHGMYPEQIAHLTKLRAALARIGGAA